MCTLSCYTYVLYHNAYSADTLPIIIQSLALLLSFVLCEHTGTHTPIGSISLTPYWCRVEGEGGSRCSFRVSLQRHCCTESGIVFDIYLTRKRTAVWGEVEQRLVPQHELQWGSETLLRNIMLDQLIMRSMLTLHQ